MRDEEEERYFWGPGARWSLTLSLLILLALPLLVWCCLGWRMRATTMSMEFSVDMAMTGLLLSRSSYCEAELVRNWTCRVCVESVPDFQLHRLYSNDTVNTLGLSGVLPTEKLIIVAFRGTANFDNWVHDLKFFFEPYPNPECAGCAVHLGFYQAFESVRDAVREDVAELVRRHPSHRVLVTGHSLGGAIALLSAVDMVRLPPPAGPSVSRPALGSPPHVGSGLVSPSRVALYTFGAPRLGNANFTRWAGAVLQHSYRLTHQRDLVPHLPPNSLGFVHMPQEKWFSNATDPLAVTHCNDTVEEEDATCSNSVWTPVVSDHRLYLGIPTGCRPTDADQYSF